MYLNNVAKVFGVGDLDPKLFPDVLLREGEIHYITYIFDALPYIPPGGDFSRKEAKSRYLEAIQYIEHVTVEQGYVAPKSSKCRSCGAINVVPVQKQVDVRLSVRLVSLAYQKVVDRIVLVCGDGDMIPAVRAISQTGVICRVAYAKEKWVNTNDGLIKCCNESHLLSKEDLEKMAK
jgi:uncharacterized LabA/DUF88 family protein